jgi:hypothetical protein
MLRVVFLVVFLRGINGVPIRISVVIGGEFAALFQSGRGRVGRAFLTGRGEKIAERYWLPASGPWRWSWLFPPLRGIFKRATQTTRVICCNGSRLLVEAEEDHNFGYELMERVSQIVIHRLQASRQRYMGFQVSEEISHRSVAG